VSLSRLNEKLNEHLIRLSAHLRRRVSLGLRENADIYRCNAGASPTTMRHWLEYLNKWLHEAFVSAKRTNKTPNLSNHRFSKWVLDPCLLYPSTSDELMETKPSKDKKSRSRSVSSSSSDDSDTESRRKTARSRSPRRGRGSPRRSRSRSRSPVKDRRQKERYEVSSRSKGKRDQRDRYRDPKRDKDTSSRDRKDTHHSPDANPDLPPARAARAKGRFWEDKRCKQFNGASGCRFKDCKRLHECFMCKTKSHGVSDAKCPKHDAYYADAIAAGWDPARQKAIEFGSYPPTDGSSWKSKDQVEGLGLTEASKARQVAAAKSLAKMAHSP